MFQAVCREDCNELKNKTEPTKTAYFRMIDKNKSSFYHQLTFSNPHSVVDYCNLSFPRSLKNVYVVIMEVT